MTANTHSATSVDAPSPARAPLMRGALLVLEFLLAAAAPAYFLFVGLVFTVVSPLVAVWTLPGVCGWLAGFACLLHDLRWARPPSTARERRVLVALLVVGLLAWGAFLVGIGGWLAWDNLSPDAAGVGLAVLLVLPLPYGLRRLVWLRRGSGDATPRDATA